MNDSQANILPPGHNCLTRRNVIKAMLASTGAAAFSSRARAAATKRSGDSLKGSPKRYAMKKSINQWAFPYPQRMNLKECLQLAKNAGFDGIELNYDLENDLSPSSSTKDYQAIRRLADKIGIRISGLCSFLFWPYPLTSNDPGKRAKGMELAGIGASLLYYESFFVRKVFRWQRPWYRMFIHKSDKAMFLYIAYPASYSMRLDTK